MPATQTKITVQISKPNITCIEKDGQAHLHRAKQDQIRWISHDGPFTLVFTDFDSGATVPAPFTPPPTFPTTDTNWLTVHVSAVPRYFKYFVKAPGCNDLDPIIIVDN